VPEDLIGKLVRCPSCGQTFTAAANAPTTEAADRGEVPANVEPSEAGLPPGAEPAAALETAAADASASKPARDRLEPCPYCGERIERSAVRCKHCGEVLDDEDEEGDRPWEDERRFRGRRDAEPHRGVLILVLGILSIVLVGICAPLGLPFGIAAWILGQGDLRKIRANLMDREGEGLTQAGRICGIIGTILDSLCAVGWLGYFGFIFTMVGAMKNMPPPGAPGPVPAPPPQVPPAKKVQAEYWPQKWQDYLPGRPC
jgi:hypothetical protein